MQAKSGSQRERVTKVKNALIGEVIGFSLIGFSIISRICSETGRLYIPSSDHVDVICGQATIGYELHHQVSDLDAILVTTSGGGMLAGIALATQALAPNCKVKRLKKQDYNNHMSFDHMQ